MSANSAYTLAPISAHEWDSAIKKRGAGSALLTSAWEEIISKALPFISFVHYRYGNTHVLRLARMRGRFTTAPFAEGGDVVAVAGNSIDMGKLQRDITDEFGEHTRVRLYERICPAASSPSAPVRGHEHVVELPGLSLSRVRKTLRHILRHSSGGGTIACTHADADISRAYRLYAAHMRDVCNLALPEDAFRALCSTMGADLWVWRKERVAEATAVFIPGASEVLYALSASSKKGYRAHAPHHLVWAALMHYRRKGAMRASLGTTGKDTSLATFKRGWRGEEYAVYELGGREHEAARTSPLRSLVRFVPLSFYPSLTPLLGKYFL